MKISNIKRLTLSALCVALCVVLPMAFHVIPNAGAVMLPMHLPVLLCGLVCGWQYGLLCGLVGPLVSSILTGMPPAAMLPGMMVECGMYGCVGGLMMERIRTGSLYADLYISLPVAMLMGRVMSGKGGDTILRVTNEILADEYPELAAKCNVTLPDEKMRRVGQSVAAASLPELRK